ncbi:nodulation efficiency protein NfeD [Bacillus sp. V3B]|nr:nodulation efficiency protein NfeD [Bacillus sp. V3B]
MVRRYRAFISSLLAVFLLAYPIYVNAFTVIRDGQTNSTFLYQLAEFITNPIVIPILLTIGFLGFVVELFTPRIGLPGIIGLLGFLLFFYGHLVVGLADLNTVILFVVGIVLILLELVLPGGIIGILGFAAFLASFFLAAEDFVHTGISLLIAFVISILASVVMIKVYDKKMKFFKKLILTDSTSTESGYVSNRNRTELIGISGYALTDLRPSGTIILEDERVDVVSEGGFIKKGATVKVVKVEGSRIVVREVMNLKKD